MKAEKSLENCGALRMGTAGGGQLRWVATELTGAVEHARLALDLSPLATIAFGRALSSAAMLLRLSTKRPRWITADFKGAGNLGRILAECDAEGRLRGIVGERHAVGIQGASDLRVGPALGLGLMIVRREEEDGQSYESRVVLADGEIGTDVAHFLEQSEQRQSAVLVGVNLSSAGVDGAAGLIIEALPSASSDLIDTLEGRLASAHSISQAARDHGLNGVEGLLAGLEPRPLEEWALKYDCGCTRESLVGSLRGLPTDELQSLAASDGTLDAECGYCRVTYRISLLEALEGRTN